MQYRKLGKSGIEVSEIGFGCWGIGGLSRGATSYGHTDDAQSRRALQRAFELGITLYDTSDLYGYGHSEELLGDVFQEARSRVVIASKVGFLEHLGPQDFSPEYIRCSVEGTLRRLRTDYLDLYQLHSPDLDIVKHLRTFETLRVLRDEGKIRACGVSVRSSLDGLRVLEQYPDVDAIQVNLNMVDQRPVETGLIERCERQGVAVIARTPLCFGFLTGQYDPNITFDARDHRSTWPREQIARWATAYRDFIEVARAAVSQTAAQFALRYCLSYAAVASVIPGMLKSEEVEENVRASRLGPLEHAEKVSIETIYRNATYFLGGKAATGAPSEKQL